MDPGRELDTLIAEKVFGFKVIETDVCNGKDNLWLLGKGDLRFGDQELPEYSVDIRAAWEVVEKIKEPLRGAIGFSKYADSYFTIYFAPEFGWTVGYQQYDDWFILERAPTLPHAICLAALKVTEDDRPSPS